MKNLRVGIWVTVILVLGTTGNCLLAQMAGMRTDSMPSENVLTPLTVEAANSHIAITGTCQKRVKPTSIRLIWAVVAEDADASKCRQLSKEKVAKVTAAWQQMGIGADQIVEDFISAVPKFDWIQETRGEEGTLVEQQTGYRLQTNLHVKVKSDEEALESVNAALTAGLTDLIGVDYAADLEQIQEQALAGAISAATKKSSLLMNVMFDSQPKPINLQEVTKVHLPAEMYHSFENVANSNVTVRYDDRRARIAAYRPKNTYYSGLTKEADDKDWALPMSPEIVVESTVTLYYQSPSTREIVSGK